MAATLALAVADADARAGRGGSFGSRGSQTYSAPPSTATSPTARPIERSMTQPGQPGGALAAAPVGCRRRPAACSAGRASWAACSRASSAPACSACCSAMASPAGSAASPRCSASCCRSASSCSIGYLLWTWWQRRNQPALANGPSLSRHVNSGDLRHRSFRIRVRRTGGGGSALAAGGARPAPTRSALTPEDFNTFERLLGEMQAAYSAEDLGRLRARATPGDGVLLLPRTWRRTPARGVVNQHLRREAAAGRSRRSLARRRHRLCHRRDALFAQRPDGRPRQRHAWSRGGPDEATEVWTFMRVRGGHWLVSAIQQT